MAAPTIPNKLILVLVLIFGAEFSDKRAPVRADSLGEAIAQFGGNVLSGEPEVAVLVHCGGGIIAPTADAVAERRGHREPVVWECTWPQDVDTACTFVRIDPSIGRAGEEARSGKS